MLMPNIELVHKKDITLFRRLAIGTWRTAYDPSVYGTMQVRMNRATAYIEAFRQRTGARLTVSHLVARAAAEALKKMPDANAVLRFNRIYLRKRIGVFFQVVLREEETGKLDLSGATLFDVEEKSLSEIVAEMEEKVMSVRKGTDKALEKSRKSFQFVPLILMNYVLRLVSFLAYTLNLDLSSFGMPKDPFGSIMITNIGVLGLEAAYVPIVPYSRVPILLALGAVKEVPAVVDGAVQVVKVMDINATFDHRIMEGAQAARMAAVIRAWMEDPEGHFGPIPEA
jgi:pyruvate/2-oxoglutarate dehydrogenase complex dihydrolipoamide acyltransferase (E2) component